MYAQLVLELDWGSEPWEGRTPRSLTKVARGVTCVVDKSVVCCASREANRIAANPAQFQFYISDGDPYGSK